MRWLRHGTAVARCRWEPAARAPSPKRCWRTRGLRHYFSAVVAADHVVNHKPAPDTFLLCAERMGVAPEKCVVFEDADFGLQAAKRAGMDAVDVRLL